MLLPFRNVMMGAAQTWLVTGAPLMLADNLSRYRELRVVPESRLTAARRRLGIATDSAPDATQLRRLADETDGWTAISGNVFATGSALRISAQALDVATGKELVRAEVEVAADADPRAAFGRLSVKLLEVTGTKAAAADSSALPTTSLDAYRAYVRGIEFTQRSAFRRAQAAFTDAVKLDSTFALAWAKLAIAAMGWNAQVIVDPAGATMRALSQATIAAQRLPARQALLIRAMQTYFSGQTTRGRALADSLVRTDADDLDAREFLAIMEMLDPMVDTTRSPPQLKASVNRAITLARDVLERDPGRRYLYSIPAYIYGIGGGLWSGRLGGARREAGSFAAMFGVSTGGVFIPVLRADSIVVMPARDFVRLAADDTLAARRRSADAAQLWVDRWLGAGPGDGEAHLWASRTAELGGDLRGAMRELTVAESLGVESAMENVAGRRMMLHVQLREYARAAAIADSLLNAGVLAVRPLITPIDRTRKYGAAALLLTKQWERAASLAQAMGTQTPPCANLQSDLYFGQNGSLAIADVRAVMDTVARHFAEVLEVAGLARCADEIALSLVSDSASAARTIAGAALLAAADSLLRAGKTVPAFRAARGAGRADASLRPLLAQKDWFMARTNALAIGTRFMPDSAVVAKDSLVLRFHQLGGEPLTIDAPGLATNWIFQFRAPAVFRSDSVLFIGEWRYGAAPTDSGRTGSVADMVASLTFKQASLLPRTASYPDVPLTVSPTTNGFVVVVRGEIIDALKRLKPATIILSSNPCYVNLEGLCTNRTLGVIYR
jgi:TolB-like protein